MIPVHLGLHPVKVNHAHDRGVHMALCMMRDRHMSKQGQTVVVKIAGQVKIQERKATETVTSEVQAAAAQI